MYTCISLLKLFKIPTLKFKQKQTIIWYVFHLIRSTYIFMAWAWAIFCFVVGIYLYIYFVDYKIYSHGLKNYF